MTPEERLQSLQDFAEEKKYVHRGEAGTLPGGVGGMNALVFGGPMRTVQPQYDTPLAPPSYRIATGEEAETTSKKRGSLKKWLAKHREKKQAKSEESDNGSTAT